MTVYTPNIPQPTDDPSDSQDQILQNFQTLNTLYGTTGDHYPWNNTDPAVIGRHARVTLPGLPTAGNAPGDVLPTPIANEGAAFALTAGSQTFPFWRRDNETLNYPLGAIRAMGRGSTGGTIIGNAFNMATIVQSPSGTWTFTFTNAEPDTNYIVLATPLIRTSGDPTWRVENILTTSFQVVISGGVVSQMSAIVFRYSA